jgi:hypothetical protein
VRDLFRKHDEAWAYYAARAVRSREQWRLAGCHWVLRSIDGAGFGGQTTGRGEEQPQAAAEESIVRKSTHFAAYVLRLYGAEGWSCFGCCAPFSQWSREEGSA